MAEERKSGDGEVKHDDGRNEGPPELLLARFQQLVVRQPDKVLFTYLKDNGSEMCKYTYQEVDAITRQLAIHIRCNTGAGLGVEAGAMVMLVYPPSLDFILAYLACLRAGVVAVPAYPPDPSNLQKNVLMFATIQSNCGAQVALTSKFYNAAKQAAKLKSMFSGKKVSWPEMTWVATDGLYSKQLAQPEGLQLDASGADDLAFLQYTSGSTAAPKGVMVTHGNLAHNLQTIIRSLYATDDTIVVSWLPQYHDMGLIGSHLGATYCGGSGVYMSPLSFIKNPPMWVQAMSKYRATHVQAPNFAYALTVRKLKSQNRIKLADLDLSSVRHMFNAAEPIDPVAVEQFLKTFGPAGFKVTSMSPGYGLAEHTVYVCDKGHQVLDVDKVALEKDNIITVKAETSLQGLLESGNASEAVPEGVSRLVGCGYPKRNHDVEVVIVDSSTFKPLADGLVGEIWVNSPSKAVGYWGLPDKSRSDFHALPTAEEVATDVSPAAAAGAGEGEAGAGEGASDAAADDVIIEPATAEEGGYLRTGDLGFLYNGELFICGRCKDLIIIRGRNHYPQDIEHSVEMDPRLRAGCSSSFSVPGPDGERLVVLGELRDAKEKNVTQVLDTMRSAIARDHGVSVYDIRLYKAHTVPKTTSGKIARQWGRKAYLAESLPAPLGRSLASEHSTGEAGHKSAPRSSEGKEAPLPTPGPDGDGPRHDIRGWSDKKLQRMLVDTVARLTHLDPKSVNKRGALSQQMDSLSLSQLQGALKRDFGLHIGNGEMFAEHLTIKYIVKHRLLKSVPLDMQEFANEEEMKAAASRPEAPFCMRFFPCCTCCYK